jgi:hypothetical protein
MPRRDDDSDLDSGPRRHRRRVERMPDTKPVLILVCLGIGLLLVVGVGFAAYVLLRIKPGDGLGTVGGPPGSDLEQLAGAWECTFRDPAGRVTMHKVKQLAGTTETATWYRPDGSVFRINRVEFELTSRGPNKVFRYFNGWATDGTGRGGQPFPSGEYVYTLEGHTWTEYESNGNVIVWTRRR